MAYQTYITEALVCGSWDGTHADRTFLLFTREAGMLTAQAKSVREERSKQRYALQECSHVRVTLIRGKSGWKIRGAESIRNFYAHATTREGRTFLRNIILLLRRVIRGETSHEEIFDDVIKACGSLESDSHQNLELVLSLRILHALGYVAPSPVYGGLIHCPFPRERIALLTPQEVQACAVTIEHALIQSHL